MPIEILLLPVVAALVGRGFRDVVGWIAPKIGFSQREAQRAVATGGVSLVVEAKPGTAEAREEPRVPAGV